MLKKIKSIYKPVLFTAVDVSRICGKDVSVLYRKNFCLKLLRPILHSN